MFRKVKSIVMIEGQRDLEAGDIDTQKKEGTP